MVGRFFRQTTTWVDYENDNRLSTDDYRYGYSYRGTRDYFHRSVYPELRSDGAERQYDLDYDRDYGYEREL